MIKLYLPMSLVKYWLVQAMQTADDTFVIIVSHNMLYVPMLRTGVTKISLSISLLLWFVASFPANSYFILRVLK